MWIPVRSATLSSRKGGVTSFSSAATKSSFWSITYSSATSSSGHNIIYRVDQKVGHLALFVSSKVGAKEDRNQLEEDNAIIWVFMNDRAKLLAYRYFDPVPPASTVKPSPNHYGKFIKVRKARLTGLAIHSGTCQHWPVTHGIECKCTRPQGG